MIEEIKKAQKCEELAIQKMRVATEEYNKAKIELDKTFPKYDDHIYFTLNHRLEDLNSFKFNANSYRGYSLQEAKDIANFILETIKKIEEIEGVEQ